MLPRDLQQVEDDDLDHCPPGPNDDADLDHGGGAPARVSPLDPLANFIQELQYPSSMSGPDISTLVSDLPMPQEGNVKGMSVADAKARCYPFDLDGIQLKV